MTGWPSDWSPMPNGNPQTEPRLPQQQAAAGVPGTGRFASPPPPQRSSLLGRMLALAAVDGWCVAPTLPTDLWLSGATYAAVALLAALLARDAVV